MGNGLRLAVSCPAFARKLRRAGSGPAYAKAPARRAVVSWGRSAGGLAPGTWVSLGSVGVEGVEGGWILDFEDETAL